jgi:hypothetical protein
MKSRIDGFYHGNGFDEFIRKIFHHIDLGFFFSHWQLLVVILHFGGTLILPFTDVK